MEESKQMDGLADSAAPKPESRPAAPVVQPKRSVSRALERAALRELKNRKREQYAVEDAADAAEVARMREARLEADDAARAAREATMGTDSARRLIEETESYLRDVTSGRRRRDRGPDTGNRGRSQS